jgi:hypothetical protein
MFFLFALRERQGRTEAVEAKMQDERRKQTPFVSLQNNNNGL